MGIPSPASFWSHRTPPSVIVARRTTRIRTWRSTSTRLDLSYVYGLNGNPTSVNSGQETFGYDDLNRLTSASGPFGTLTYSYDNREAYDETMHEDPEVSPIVGGWIPKWDAVIVPGSKKGEVWTEVEELRVEFKQSVA
jgi:hypothetical protein